MSLKWWDPAVTPRLTREDLDAVRCQCGKPSCEEPVEFHCADHPKAGLLACYFDGALMVGCPECMRIVFVVGVERRAVAPA